MAATFGPIALAAGIATLFGVLPLVLNAFLVPRRANPVKNAPYECGVETIGPTRIQFRTHFYLYALVFVIFDVEVVFLLPWAVSYHQLGLFALVEMAIFVALLMAGWAYAWRKRALEWV